MQEYCPFYSIVEVVNQLKKVSLECILHQGIMSNVLKKNALFMLPIKKPVLFGFLQRILFLRIAFNLCRWHFKKCFV